MQLSGATSEQTRTYTLNIGCSVRGKVADLALSTLFCTRLFDKECGCVLEILQLCIIIVSFATGFVNPLCTKGVILKKK
jgi:hypothetical protein